MQNQIALYLIFLTGILLIIASIFNLDIILGPKKVDDEEKEKKINRNIRTPMLTRWINWLSGAKYYDSEGMIHQDFDSQRRNRRIMYFFLGALIIVLGIIALNSGKFS